MTVDSIRADPLLSARPHRVWPVLTDPELLGAWLPRSDFQAQAGHRFTFPTDPGRLVDLTTWGGTNSSLWHSLSAVLAGS